MLVVALLHRRDLGRDGGALAFVEMAALYVLRNGKR
jgi:hypothetical protein